MDSEHPVASPPAPGGGQPGGSWDPEHDHFDVDDGLGNRVRIKPDGTTVDDNHLPMPNLPLPPRFPGVDRDIAAQFHCVTVVTITVGLGGIILLIIFQVCSGAAWG